MKPPCVLLADNDAPVNALLCGLLDGQGLACEAVLDGVAALERLQQGGVDVLISDLDMPKLSGLELIEAVRDGIRPLPKIVVISGFIDADVEARLNASSVVCEVMRKPFDVMEFASRIAELAQPGAAGQASV